MGHVLILWTYHCSQELGIMVMKPMQGIVIGSPPRATWDGERLVPTARENCYYQKKAKEMSGLLTFLWNIWIFGKPDK